MGVDYVSLNACHCYGIVTNDHKIAKAKIEQLADSTDWVRRSLNVNNTFLKVINGDYYKWIKPTENSVRGHRFHKVYFGKDISIDQYVTVKQFTDYGWTEEEECI